LKDNFVKNLSINLNFTLTRNEELKHYIMIKIYKSIIFKFWVDSGVNVLYD